MPYQISDDQSNTSRNPSHAMDQNICSFSLLFNKIVRLLEVVADIKSFMINCRDIHVLDMLWDNFIQIFPFNCSNHCLDAKLYINGFTTFQSERVLSSLDIANEYATAPLDRLDNALNILREFLRVHQNKNGNIIILLMENLPPIHDMYSCIQQQRDFDVTRKYEHPPLPKNQGQLKRYMTKKGSYLDDAIKMSSSPGPANNSNIQQSWVNLKADKQIVKYSDRKTYVDQIQASEKKRNSPSPSHYNLKLPWPDKQHQSCISSEKINFLDHSQYQSIQTPGPGSYIVATKIAKKCKQYHYNPHKPLQPRKQVAADMNTYDPVPQEYATFKGYQKFKSKTAIKKQQKQVKKGRENLSPGPGQYQMIHSWQGKYKKLPQGSLSYLNKITRGPSPNVYYH